mmetsp:Transcript_27739/g.60663  ORF Transcript_27739/g.60663 Transcript_27739/m.60663 type:complete len:146 (+) Transcript_27739:72-509(+)
MEPEPARIDWPPKELDFNTKGFEKYHHIVQYPVDGEVKTVKICRCWQSKKFPYCDDTHKALVQAGDPVGPYVAKIQGGSPKVQNVAANSLYKHSKVSRGASFMVGLAVMGLTSAAAMAYARGHRVRFQVNAGAEGVAKPSSADLH